MEINFHVIKIPANPNAEHWQKHLDFLRREHPDHIEDIALAKLEILQKSSSGEDRDRYKQLEKELIKEVSEGSKTIPDFGFDDVQRIATKFVERNNLDLS